MRNAELVKEENGGANLMGDLFGAFFRNCEVAVRKVAEEITAFQEFHHDVYVVLVFEDVEETDDVWVLAQFQHFYLTF